MELRPEESTCAWCGKALRGLETMWLVNARAVGDLPEHEGRFVPFKLAKSGRTVAGFLAASSVKRETGADVVFSTCGQECAQALKAAIREETDALGLVII